MKARTVPKREEQLLRQVLEYSPRTGFFKWKEKVGKNIPIGSIAGSPNNHGYHGIRLRGRLYKAHRLAWMFKYGQPIPPILDHINGDTLDNRIKNLRPVTWSQSNAHRRVFRTNKSGYRGVYKQGETDKWVAGIRVHRKYIHLGYFKTPEEAHERYKKAARKYFGKYSTAPISSGGFVERTTQALC